MKVLLFAHLREEHGSESISLDLESMTVADMLVEFQRRYPNLTIGQSMIAVNEQFVGQDYPLHPDDIIAFIPPVSGG
ncbi:MoaD/ThiS family protein [Paenibacillus sp. CMAA1364]